MSWPDIENYHAVFHKYPRCLIYDKGSLCGWWWEGRNFEPPIKYHGAYPPSFLKRVRALFPRSKSTLHLFSGVVVPTEGEVTFDINPALKPSVVGDAENLSNYFDPGTFDLIIADPPYTEKDAHKYGYRLPKKRRVIKEASKVTRPGGFLLWLEALTYAPQFSREEWRIVGTIGLYLGTMRAPRTLFIYRKPEEV